MRIYKGVFLRVVIKRQILILSAQKIMTQYKILILNIEEQDKSSDIEQQPPFCDRK